MKTARISRSARVSKAKEEHIKECERRNKIQKQAEEAEEAERIKNELIQRETEEAERIKNERIQREVEEAERIKNERLQREAEIAERARRDQLVREAKEREKIRLEVSKKREEEKRKYREQQLESERKKQIILQQQRELELKKKIEAEAIRREASRKEEEDTQNRLDESANNLAKKYEESGRNHVKHQEELDLKMEDQSGIREICNLGKRSDERNVIYEGKRKYKERLESLQLASQASIDKEAFMDEDTSRKHKIGRRRRDRAKDNAINVIATKENTKKDTEKNLNRDLSKKENTVKKLASRSHKKGEECFDSNKTLNEIQDKIISKEEINSRRQKKYAHERARKYPLTIYSINDDSEDDIGYNFREAPDDDKTKKDTTTRNRRNYGDGRRRKRYATEEKSDENLANNSDQDTSTRGDKVSQNKVDDHEQTKMCMDIEEDTEEIKDSQMKRKENGPSSQKFHTHGKRSSSTSKEALRKNVERDNSIPCSERKRKRESTTTSKSHHERDFEQNSHVNGTKESNDSGHYPSKARKISHQEGQSGRLKHSTDNRTRKNVLDNDRRNKDCADENAESKKVENRKESQVRKKRRTIYGKTHTSPRQESKSQSKDHSGISQTKSRFSSKENGSLMRSNHKDVPICDTDLVKKSKVNATSDSVISSDRTNRLLSRKTTESTKLLKKNNKVLLTKSASSAKVTTSRLEKTIDLFSSTLNDSNSMLNSKSKDKRGNSRSDRNKSNKFRATKELSKSKTTSRRRKKVSTCSRGNNRSQGKTSVMDGTDYEFSFM